MEEIMKKSHFRIKANITLFLVLIMLCGCNLFVTDKDKFYMDENPDHSLSRIDIEKAGKDIVIPAKVGDITVREIYLADPYYSKIDSLDVSNVKKLESFTLKLFSKNTGSKLKKLDFSKNNKLNFIVVSKTKALKEITFNDECKSIQLDNTSVKKVDIRLLKNLDNFVYYDGPLEELDVSNNPNLEQIWIENANIKVLDVSKNPKLKNITVDEGTQIIGPTKAQIKYNKRTE